MTKEELLTRLTILRDQKVINEQAYEVTNMAFEKLYRIPTNRRCYSSGNVVYAFTYSTNKNFTR